MLLLSGTIAQVFKEIPTIFQNWETGAQPKLAHAYYVFPFIFDVKVALANLEFHVHVTSEYISRQCHGVLRKRSNLQFVVVLIMAYSVTGKYYIRKTKVSLETFSSLETESAEKWKRKNT